jgi:hypothetical protein
VTALSSLGFGDALAYPSPSVYHFNAFPQELTWETFRKNATYRKKNIQKMLLYSEKNEIFRN